MASLQDSLTIARSAILTHQERLAVISHNIANVNTPGYHRQKAVLATNPSSDPTMLETRDYSIGAGVRIADVVRTYSRMKETLLLDTTSDTEQHAIKGKGMADLEAIVGGTGDGSLSDHLQKFWNAWQDVANNAESIAFRSVLLERGVALSARIQNLYGSVADYRTGIATGGAGPAFDGVVLSTVDEANSIASRIQEINARMAAAPYSRKPHDLNDSRDQLIRQLSQITGIAVSSDFDITIDGQTLVNGDGTVRNDLTLDSTITPMGYSLDGTAVAVTGGSLGGWGEVAGEVDVFLARIDTVAGELISAVNNIHNSDLAGVDSYDMSGARCDWNFFEGSTAADIAVNSTMPIHDPGNPLNDDPGKIAAAASRYSGGPPPVANPGDGAKALEIADLGAAGIAGLGNISFSEYLSGVVAGLGAVVQAEEELTADGEVIEGMVLDAIQDESGVNLDEELIEMISAQKAYQAAARLMSTINDMLDVIINRM